MNELITIDQEGKEVETAIKVLEDSLDAPALDPIVLTVANEYLAGKEIPLIAEEYDVPADIITKVLEKKDVKDYVNSVYQSQGYMNRVKRMKLINKVLEAKLEEALDTEVFTKKDLLDWLKMLHTMDVDSRPKDKEGPQVAVQINNNYTELMQDLFNKAEE